jgi:predicted nucleic acid-binding Zn ribbon protein
MVMDRLSLLLPKVLQKRGFHQLAVASGVVISAQRWMDAEMGMHAPALHARKFADGTLVVDAANPIALSELSRRIPQLLQILKEQLPDTPLAAIRCQRAATGR